MTRDLLLCLAWAPWSELLSIEVVTCGVSPLSALSQRQELLFFQAAWVVFPQRPGMSCIEGGTLTSAVGLTEWAEPSISGTELQLPTYLLSTYCTFGEGLLWWLPFGPLDRDLEALQAVSRDQSIAQAHVLVLGRTHPPAPVLL